MSPLLTAGLAHGEDASNKDVAVVGVGSETPFAPQHRRAQRAFGGIVRWFDPLGGDKRPKSRFPIAHVRAEKPSLPGEVVPALVEKGVNPSLKRRHAPDQLGSVSPLVGQRGNIGVGVNQERRGPAGWESFDSPHPGGGGPSQQNSAQTGGGKPPHFALPRPETRCSCPHPPSTTSGGCRPASSRSRPR